MSEIDNGQKPGIEGCSYRLAKHWPPENICDWLEHERMRNTPAAAVLTPAIAQVMAAAAMIYAINMNDARAAILDPDGLLRAFEAALQVRINHYNGRTAGGIFIPAGKI